LGSDASIDDCKTVKSFADTQKYVLAADSIPKALFQKAI
jgi:hypothetical protein